MTGNDVPITVIAGYLGAGKTTLINRLLSERENAEGLAVLVNDFGDINIDEALIRAKSPDGQIIGLSNGCVCCSIRSDLADSFERLRKFDLHEIIMEASGVASPGKLAAQCHYPGYFPQRTVVLVDAVAFTHQSTDKYVGNLVRQQVAEADEIIITKMALNPEFALPEDIDGKRIEAESVIAAFTSLTLLQTQPVDPATLSCMLQALPDWVARVKGFVATRDGQTLLAQRAGGATHLELAARSAHQGTRVKDGNRMVFIAPAAKREQLEALLESDWATAFAMHAGRGHPGYN